DAGVEHRVKEGGRIGGIDPAQPVVLGVHHGGQSVEPVQEGQSAGIHRAGLAIVHQQDEGNVLVHDLEGTVEEFAGVEGTGVDPLHLHHQADGGGVGHLSGSTARHDVDDRSVSILDSELLGSLAGCVGAVLGQLKNGVEAGQHLL